ncbi:ABC transporter ATP-binding protein [Mesorhizobium sp. BR1-1-16]|uniref:ABC transporter ATP-binding protein n=1 Tax=Mesorhizobium sp. BR1-1-16 TaxID=2876653 RepID=UPI001CCA4B8C|nr:ABC transporter ATP-binding protein [Mesorhizobium sp. BR1-1-16]MBZ9939278.1 ABC transporter ATP-binding protein [Mesorhizobium sp. BR1-1-16]
MADVESPMAGLLAVEDLTVAFGRGSSAAAALRDVSFALRRGETLALVGESGSGKSLTALSIMGLLPTEGQVSAGRVLLGGDDLLRKSRDDMIRTRGSRVSMVFQEPMTSLNPVLTIGRQLTEGLQFHRKVSRAAADARALDLLRLVGMTNPEARLKQYPHQLSGGMRQRVMIAMALACEPDLIIADEPTTALDVSIQAQIIDLLLDIKERLGTSILLITHDLGVVAEMADRIAVLYAGRVVEIADCLQLFDAPRHPYTEGLLAAVPRLDLLVADGADRIRLAELPGSVPSPGERLSGCPFAPRCSLAIERCSAEMPPMRTVAEGHTAACWVRAAA